MLTKTINNDLLKSATGKMNFNEGSAKIEANSVSPEDWQDFSQANILKAERKRQSSVDLRSLVDGILQQACNDMRKQCREVNVAFDKRIAETKDTQMEDHLNKMEENIAQLQKDISDKEQPMKLAQTRLDTHTQRPNVELYRDPVQYHLIPSGKIIRRGMSATKPRATG
ncbi:hypothetical protein DPMN_174518 [Dreissena polymorpha]|uniref:Tektin n=1 Tax=Dreissena polymorpha TaxID=45954 RepID=A0A9D4IIN0_DREPO|nr:hypothetical protein DPMN_174518 [Dreissena polymorpha]